MFIHDGKKIYNVVFTGGPCGGKTSSMASISEFLRAQGHGVVIVPETARLVIANAFPDIDRFAVNEHERYLGIQEAMLRMQMVLYSSSLRFAKLRPESTVVLLHDRSFLDNQAYLRSGREDFDRIANAVGASRYELLGMFDGVIHLVTAADGAETHYARDFERQDSLERARELDRLTLEAWYGTTHLAVIDNSTDFNGKLFRARQALAGIVGIPVPVEIERKFLVRSVDRNGSFMETAVASFIEQMYLDAPEGEEDRIRMRGRDGAWCYYRTSKRNIRPGMRSETERHISCGDYNELSSRLRPGTDVIYKERFCGVHKGQYFELDFFNRPDGLVVLEAELTEEGQMISIPPDIEIDREVTGDPAFSNYGIARQLAA